MSKKPTKRRNTDPSVPAQKKIDNGFNVRYI